MAAVPAGSTNARRDRVCPRWPVSPDRSCYPAGRCRADRLPSAFQLEDGTRLTVFAISCPTRLHRPWAPPRPRARCPLERRPPALPLTGGQGAARDPVCFPVDGEVGTALSPALSPRCQSQPCVCCPGAQGQAGGVHLPSPQSREKWGEWPPRTDVFARARAVLGARSLLTSCCVWSLHRPVSPGEKLRQPRPRGSPSRPRASPCSSPSAAPRWEQGGWVAGTVGTHGCGVCDVHGSVPL